MLMWVLPTPDLGEIRLEFHVSMMLSSFSSLTAVIRSVGYTCSGLPMSWKHNFLCALFKIKPCIYDSNQRIDDTGTNLTLFLSVMPESCLKLAPAISLEIS